MSSGSHPRSSTEASNKRKASAKPTSSPSAIPEVAIAPQQKPERLLALMREHKQLLAKIKQKQSETSRLGSRIATAIAVAHQEAKPILEKTARLERQIHDLFAELLARKSQPHGTRTTVQLMYTVRTHPTTSCPQIPRQQTYLRHPASYCARAAFHCRGSSSSMRLCGQSRLSLSKTSRR